MTFIPDRFGFAPVVTKRQLVAMAPHVRSECIALMREAGLTVEQIARPLNVRPQVVRRLADARHLYRIPKPDIADEDGESEKRPVRKAEGLPRGSFIILKYAAERQFEVKLSKGGLAQTLGVSERVIDVGMTRLIDEGFMLRLRAGIGGKPPHYRVTEAGEKLAAAVFNLEAAEA